MKITRLGIDLAKGVFQIHGVDRAERRVVRRRLKRAQLVAYFTQLAPCLIGMEACASAHHWARTLMAMGHTVRLIAPQFVKPYVKGNKNDAEAICEAVARPNMRFVPVKTVEQQNIQALHRVRSELVQQRTAKFKGITGAGDDDLGLGDIHTQNQRGLHEGLLGLTVGWSGWCSAS